MYWRQGRKFSPYFSGWEFCCRFSWGRLSCCGWLPPETATTAYSSGFCGSVHSEIITHRGLVKKKLIHILKINHILSWTGACVLWRAEFSSASAGCCDMALGSACSGSGLVCSCMSTTGVCSGWRAPLYREEQGPCYTTQLFGATS